MDSSPFADAYRELNQRFMKLLDDLSALRSLSDLGWAVGDEQQALREAIRALMENHDLERCSVFLLEGEELHCAAGLDWQQLTAGPSAATTGRSSMVFRLGEGIMGMAAETRRLQHCRDCQRESRFLPPERRPGGGEIGSLICVPILANERVLGVVNVSHHRAGFFSENHERLLQTFANFLGQTLSNWRYLHQMEQEVRRRTRELEQALQEAEELKRRYHQLSIVDELTGLHNRRFFFSEAATALSVAVRHDQPFSVLMVDFDHFKHINDTHGHATGDRVLQIAAALLKAQIREGDVLARFGGEEFVLALPNTDENGARRMAERLRESLRTVQFECGGEQVQVTASVGIATLGREDRRKTADLLEQLLRRADQALYFGKTNGRDRSCSYAELPIAG